MRELAQERAEAAGKLADLDKSRKAVATHKKAVEKKLAKARRLLNSLPYAERAAYDRASRAGRDVIPDLGSALPASARAAAAIAAARSALGMPYIWGATGPSGFDCSGLMQWSYAQAGVHLPRTSQEQRYAGRQIPLSQARPGDLVVYRSDASHVAMYMGNGQVIHAPLPRRARALRPGGNAAGVLGHEGLTNRPVGRTIGKVAGRRRASRSSVVALVLLLVSLVACGGQPGGGSAKVDLQRVLDRRSTAVLDRDRAAFLKTGALSWFENLRGVPSPPGRTA